MGHVSRELRSLKAKGLAEVAREEDTGSRPRKFWMASAAAMEWSLGGSEAGSSGSLGSNPIKSIRSNKSYSQDSTAELLAESLNPTLAAIDPKTRVELFRGGSWANGYVVRDGTNPDKIIVEKLGSPAVTISNLRLGLDVRPCQAAPEVAESLGPFDF
jgi:hypothetical protein